MKITDISFTIEEGMIVYPGNPGPKIKQYKSVNEASTNESEIIIGSHTGTHIDTPLHVKNEGITADKIPVDFFMVSVLIDLTDAGREIRKEHLLKYDNEITEDLILLLKTENSLKHYNSFREDYTYISKEAAGYLVQRR